MKVLIVDDDLAYLQLLRVILKNKQHEVFEAADGKTAWEMIQEDPTPFVITDWMMPEMDVLELIRRIRAADLPSYTYIILLTAKHTKGDLVHGLESGADDYLTKPFDLSELKARIGIGERILNLETRLRDAMEQLYFLATRDSLTGLLNRRALYELLQNELGRATRERLPVSVVMVDVDHFKDINDQFGHLIGDQALCLLVDTITKNKRSYDQVGRWGGEEFLMILPGTDLETARQIAERLRIEISRAELNLSDGSALTMRASFGVASTSQDRSLSFDKLIQRADVALYLAKDGGRNRVMVYAEGG